MIRTPPQPKKGSINKLPKGLAGTLCTVRYVGSDGECLYWLNVTMLLPCLYKSKKGGGAYLERDIVEKRIRNFAKARKTEYVDDMFLSQMVAQDKGSECMSSSNLDAGLCSSEELDVRVPFIARLEDGELDPTMSVLVLDYEFGNSFEYD